MRFVGLAYFAAIAVIVVLADLGTIGVWIDRIHSVPLGDKALHLVLAAGLAFFANAMRIPRANLVLFPAVMLEELSQRWIPDRTFDLLDMAADVIGLTLGSAIAIGWMRRQAAAAAARGRLAT
jgi:hypothetical protein